MKPSGYLVILLLFVAFFSVITGVSQAQSQGGPNTTLATSPPVPTPAPMAGYLWYSNPSEGFRMQYPLNWTYEEGTGGSDLVTFHTPSGIENVKVGVTTVNSSNSTTLELFTDLLITYLRNDFNNFTLLERQNTTLAGSNATRIVYTGSFDGLEIKQMAVYTLKDNNVWDIIYTALPWTYDRYLDAVNKTVDSFNTTPMPPPMAGYLWYSNPSEGFRMQYPLNWTYEEGTGEGDFVTFHPPSGIENAKVGVTTVNSSNSTPLGLFTDLFVTYLRHEVSNFTLLERQNATLAGNNATRIVYTGMVDGTTYEWMQVLTMQNSRVWIITYTSLQETYDRYLEIANTMIHSFNMTRS